MSMKRKVVYTYFPTFTQILEDDRTIINRYIDMSFTTLNRNTFIILTVKQEFKHNDNLFIENLKTYSYFRDELPIRLHPAIDGLSREDIVGKTAELFAVSLFNDIYQFKNENWLIEYFPEVITPEVKSKDVIFNELNEIKRRINEGEKFEDITN